MPDLEMSCYSATVNYNGDPARIDCSCSDCCWKGKATALVRVGDAHLTPGDASPAGRCPECGALAYVDEPAKALPAGNGKHPFPHVVATVKGEDAALAVCVHLVRKSAWHELTPYPADTWLFAAKDEPHVRACFPSGTEFRAVAAA